MSNAYDIYLQNPDGKDFTAFLALPEGSAPAPAIIVIQEIFGINEDVRSKCQDWAARGYIALAPDLFWRQEPGVQLTDRTEAEWTQAFTLLKGFDLDKGVFDLRLALDYLRAHPQCNGQVGAIGYCLGGKLAYLMATRTNIDASVGYYAVDIGRLMPEADQIKTPFMLHIAEEDKYVDKTEQAKIISSLSGISLATVYSYPKVDHAFSRKNGQHYDAEAATLANTRTTDFFKTHLSPHAE